MESIIPIAGMAVFAAGLLFVTYKIARHYIRYLISADKAMKLLAENRDIADLPSKEERLVALSHWKMKRDALLMKAESQSRELSEVED